MALSTGVGVGRKTDLAALLCKVTWTLQRSPSPGPAPQGVTQTEVDTVFEEVAGHRRRRWDLL